MHQYKMRLKENSSAHKNPFYKIMHKQAIHQRNKYKLFFIQVIVPSESNFKPSQQLSTRLHNMDDKPVFRKNPKKCLILDSPRDV